MAADLEEAIVALRQYFRQPELTSPAAPPAEGGSTTLTAQLIRFIFGSNLGSMGIADMIKGIQDLAFDDQSLDKSKGVPFIVYSNCDNDAQGRMANEAEWGFHVDKKSATKEKDEDYGKLDGIIGKLNGEAGNTGDSADRDNAILSATFVMSYVVSPASRDVDAVELFFNSIPTVQLALCEPFIDVAVHTTRPRAGADGKLIGLSLLKFLEGAAEINPNSGADTVMAGQDVKEILKGGIKTTHGAAGMELFTSPQTLVPANFSSYDPELRAAPIIDRFRPFMSLLSFKVKLHGSGYGTISYKTATLELVLHDRSRLAEIAEIVNPDSFTGIHFVVEYGWSHPHGADPANAYGVFLNALRVKEKYMLKNSKFSFDTVGQVKISLDLFMLGGSAVSEVTAAQGEGVNDPFSQMQEMVALIKEGLKSLGQLSQADQKGLAGIIGNETLTDHSDIDNISQKPANNPKFKKKIAALKKKLTQAAADNPVASEDLTNIKKGLDALYNDEGERGETTVAALKTKADAIGKKLTLVG